MHREKDEARADDSFLRDTGVEVVSYEFRNKRWSRVGSLFIAEKTEENVDGRWVPVAEVPNRSLVMKKEEDRGWLSETWSRITGN